MNEKELKRALLHYGTIEAPVPPPPDPRVLTQRILQQDKREIESYAAVMLLFWLMAAASMVYLVVTFAGRLDLMAPFAVAEGGKSGLGDAVEVVVIACAAILFLLVAVFCTVMLVFVTRRATLRQVNANLIEISEQLKLLQRTLAAAGGKSPATAVGDDI